MKGAAFVVGDSNFFPRLDVTNSVNGFVLCIAVPTIVSIGETAVVNEADGRVDSTDHRAWTTGQSVCSYNTAKRVLAREVVVKGKELSLLGL